MADIEQLLDTYEQAIIDLATSRIQDESRMSQHAAERERDTAREEIVQYVEELEGDDA